jgi:hypothetical protein
MKRVIKILGLAMVLTAILVVALAGTAFAAANGDQTQLRLHDGSCDNVCDGCTPTPNYYNYNNTYLQPGPHGTQNGISE